MNYKTILLFFVLLVVFINPSQATTKCYKDICVDDRALVIGGIYKGNFVRILDIIKERTPDEDEEQVRDYYKYFVSFRDGSITELYREELEIKNEKI